MTAQHGPAPMTSDQPTGTVRCTCGWVSDTCPDIPTAINALTAHVTAATGKPWQPTFA